MASDYYLVAIPQNLTQKLSYIPKSVLKILPKICFQKIIQMSPISLKKLLKYYLLSLYDRGIPFLSSIFDIFVYICVYIYTNVIGKHYKVHKTLHLFYFFQCCTRIYFLHCWVTMGAQVLSPDFLQQGLTSLEVHTKPTSTL